MAGRNLETKLTKEIAAVAESCGCELLQAAYVGGVLRLMLDREGGVRLEDCEKVSRQVSPLLDLEDFGGGRYVLEVSSPGLDRELFGPKDFQRFHGSQARLTFQRPGMPTKRTITGRLDQFTEESGELRMVETENGEVHTISLKHILLARLEPEF